MNLIYDIAGGSKSTKSGNNNNNTDTTDIAAQNMTQVDVEGALSLFDSKDPVLLYIGRPDCSACASFLPTMIAVQNELNFTTYYANLNEIYDAANVGTLRQKLDIVTTANINGEEVTGTFGSDDIFRVTPLLIIISNGKMVDGHVGTFASADEYKEFLNNNGIGV